MRKRGIEERLAALEALVRQIHDATVIRPEQAVMLVNNATGVTEAVVGSPWPAMWKVLGGAVKTNEECARAVEQHRDVIANGFARLADTRMELLNAPRRNDD